MTKFKSVVDQTPADDEDLHRLLRGGGSSSTRRTRKKRPSSSESSSSSGDEGVVVPTLAQSNIVRLARSVGVERISKGAIARAAALFNLTLSDYLSFDKPKNRVINSATFVDQLNPDTPVPVRVSLLDKTTPVKEQIAYYSTREGILCSQKRFRKIVNALLLPEGVFRWNRDLFFHFQHLFESDCKRYLETALNLTLHNNRKTIKDRDIDQAKAILNLSLGGKKWKMK